MLELRLESEWIEAENAERDWRPTTEPLPVAVEWEGRRYVALERTPRSWRVPESAALEQATAVVRAAFRDDAPSGRAVLRLLHTEAKSEMAGFGSDERTHVKAIADLRYFDASGKLRYWRTATASQWNDFIDNDSPRFPEWQGRLFYSTQLRAITSVVDSFLRQWQSSDGSPLGAPELSLVRSAGTTHHFLLVDGEEWTTDRSFRRASEAELVLGRLVSTVPEATESYRKIRTKWRQVTGLSLATIGLGTLIVYPQTRGSDNETTTADWVVVGTSAAATVLGGVLYYEAISGFLEKIETTVADFNAAVAPAGVPTEATSPQ